MTRRAILQAQLAVKTTAECIGRPYGRECSSESGLQFLVQLAHLGTPAGLTPSRQHPHNPRRAASALTGAVQFWSTGGKYTRHSSHLHRRCFEGKSWPEG
ncbi:uncharacterized protein LOC125030846 isoform X3 [Penaeus chinensis]|uniref:uncharacterized protein LOC125030846 isoform X3 n=1 Tax=Penaeus chinensis TaxID=139456 RepID=UPI001FB6220F|nr:uncharacterized protein LOC125030846 isoform X3 [Penaeus chinensis]